MEVESKEQIIGNAAQMAEEACTLQDHLYYRISHLGADQETEKITHLAGIQTRQIEEIRALLRKAEES